MAVSFGVVDGATCTFGTPNGSEKTSTAEIAVARNTLGLVTNRQAYTRKKTAKISGVKTGTVPEAGTALTAISISGLIETATTTEANTGYAMFDVTVSEEDGVAGTALA